jgi:serine-type D-Ala-D-Ala carboxypeptidase/endopeptidase (penicillin-binding protein 4)
MRSIASLLVMTALTMPRAAIAQTEPASPTQLAQGNATQAICPAQLNSAVNAILDRPQFRRSRWGVLIQTEAQAGKSATLYTRDAQRYFIPASNTKLLTTAAALTQLKSQYRIRTSVYKVATTNNQTILRVVGRGDPSLSKAELQSLAQQLSGQGIQKIDRLIGDDSYFGGTVIHPSWEWGDLQAGYGATVNALMVNQNAIDLTLFPQKLGQPLRVQWNDPGDAMGWQIVNTSRTVDAKEPEFLEVGRDLGKPILQVTGQLRVGAAPEPVAIAVPDPAQNFLQQFRRALATRKITVVQSIVTATANAEAMTEIAFVQSPPLATLLAETNQQSNNLYAEALLRQIGKVSAAKNAPSNALEAGLVTLQSILSQLVVSSDSYRLVDGSGLSRHNLVSPEALVQTLQAMAIAPEAKVYRASLPVAGVSGTLQSRFQNTPAQGIVQAKTGTLSGAVGLSGYLNAPSYQPLVFSILVNQSTESTSTLRSAVDEIVVLLTRLRSC